MTSSYVYTLKKTSKPEVVKKAAGKIKISWDNIKGETGYQISRSSKKTSGYTVIKTVKNADAKSITLEAKQNKVYYYRVRSYKTVDGKKVYGPWSEPVKYALK